MKCMSIQRIGATANNNFSINLTAEKYTDDEANIFLKYKLWRCEYISSKLFNNMSPIL